ncbi:17100_t:CDS:2 [Gigaspora rosea]|nr:17100_t:CDS:2 [Gigaspora rosea]
MDSTHILVSPIFLKTHSEIYSLVEAFNQLKTFYQTDNDYELELKETFETKESFEIVEISNIQDDKQIQQFDNQILIPLQIEKFQEYLLNILLIKGVQRDLPYVTN